MHTQSTIPWFDLSRQTASLREELATVIDQVIRDGDFILGRRVEDFEEQFAHFVGARQCVGVNSGTSALHLALLAAGVGPGDEVITVAATWISTSWAVSYVGARPVFVDIDRKTWCLDPNRVEPAITPRTKAIIPVHLFGQPCDMHALSEIAERHGLAVIEDACQAHGAYLGSKHIGTLGKLGCFSFYPGKNLGAFGEAGAVVTDDNALATRIRQLRNHAQPARHVHTELGFNMRMDGIQGAILGAKLRHLPIWLHARRAIASRYSAAWADLADIECPSSQPRARHGWHIYALRSKQRTLFQAHLAARRIQTRIHYPTPIHLQPAYRHLGYRAGDLPETEALCREVLTMPLFPEMTEEEIQRVMYAVRAWNAQQSLQARKAA